MKKLVKGVGVNDADYKVKYTIKCEHLGITKIVCPFYKVWLNMLNRCYSKKRHRCYSDSFVCEEWLVFSKFKSWMEKQDWEGKQLDKDLLLDGNKEYNPNFFCFIPKNLNLFITERKVTKGLYPIGVDKRKGLISKPYRASIKIHSQIKEKT